jgi:hypothetical protein
MIIERFCCGKIDRPSLTVERCRFDAKHPANLRKSIRVALQRGPR